MSEQKVVALRPSEVDLSKLVFQDVRSLPSGAKLVFVNLNGGNLYIQTPELEVPFDSVFYPDGSDSAGKIPLNVSLKGHEESGKVKEFHDMLSGFDELIQKQCMGKSVEWLKKSKVSKDTIESLYSKMVRVSLDSDTGEPDGKYPPQFRFQLKKKDDKWECRFYDENRNEIKNEDGSNLTTTQLTDRLKKKSKVKALLRCTAVWISGGKFGCSWKAEQMIINSPKSLDDYAFRSDDEDDLDDEVDNDTGEQVEFVESSSEEEEEEEEEEVVETPPTKKKTRKSKK